MTARKLTPICYACQPGKWPFVLTEDFTVDLGLGLTGEHYFQCRNVPLAKLRGDILTLFRGYASDGASPYFGSVFGVRIGTPSHGKTAPGFFVHDLLYQVGETRCAPWSYEEADEILHDLMRAEGSALGGIYHAVVAIFGGLHRSFRQSPSAAICISNHRMP